MANAGDWDSLDPADTYYTYAWNFARLYGRALVMFRSAPGAEGATLVPDLAENLGTPNADQTQWTYTLRQGVRFEDGTPVTSRDVKYAVERSLDMATFPNGPTYLTDFLATIDTPDDRTIVFTLVKPFSGFDYFAQLPAMIPVPQAKDTGSKYKEHVVSTGPYMFEHNDLSKSFAMVRNPNWDQATDPHRKPLPDRIEVTLNVNADDLDNRLIAGDLDVAIEGGGVQPAAQGRILADQRLRVNTDSALGARLFYSVLNTDVPPLGDVHCRRAVLFAADRVGYQRANGGPTGGEIATNLLPPAVPGAERFDLYPSAGNQGDLERAREELRLCRSPDGFRTKVSYRSESPRERATAEALQQSLGRVGITLDLAPFPLARLLHPLRRQTGLRPGQRPRPDDHGVER